MANVTGDAEQSGSRTRRAAQFGQDYLSSIMGQIQAMMSGLGGSRSNITGDYTPDQANVTTGRGGGARGDARVTSDAGRSPAGRPARGGGALFPRDQLLGGVTAGSALLPGVGFAAQELLAGRPLSAAAGGTASLAAGGLTAAVTAPLRSANIPGVAGLITKAIGYGAPLLASSLATGVGSVAESAKARQTGQEISGKEGSLSAQLGQADKIAEAYGKISQAQLAPWLQGQKDLSQHGVDMLVQGTERLQPLAEQAQRNALVRQQQLINTMGQNFAMLGTLATAGRLAQGAQAEAGANFRTALQANPYANAVLQSPSISFG